MRLYRTVGATLAVMAGALWAAHYIWIRPPAERKAQTLTAPQTARVSFTPLAPALPPPVWKLPATYFGDYDGTRIDIEWRYQFPSADSSGTWRLGGCLRSPGADSCAIFGHYYPGNQKLKLRWGSLCVEADVFEDQIVGYGGVSDLDGRKLSIAPKTNKGAPK